MRVQLSALVAPNTSASANGRRFRLARARQAGNSDTLLENVARNFSGTCGCFELDKGYTSNTATEACPPTWRGRLNSRVKWQRHEHRDLPLPSSQNVAVLHKTPAEDS